MRQFDIRIPPPISSTFGCPVSPGAPSAGGYFSMHRQPVDREGSLPSCPLNMSFDVASRLHSPSHSVIEAGTYIAFALATDTIAARYPMGSQSNTTVRKFPAGRYIGLVVSSYTYTGSEDKKTIRELIVNYVATTPPPVLEDNWVAIAGTGDQGCPRVQPLQTNEFFPLKDGKQWTTMGIRLTVETLHDSLLNFTLGDDEFERFEQLANADYQRMGCLGVTLKPEEARWVENLTVPHYAFPAEVWRDIRVGDGRVDPSRFLDEICTLERIVEQQSEGVDGEFLITDYGAPMDLI